MKKFVLVTSVLLFSIAGVASADLVYDLVDYPAIQNGHTLSGTITTNGTIGALAISDIVGWSYSVTGFRNWSSASTDTGASTKTSGIPPTITASSTEITLSGSGDFILSGAGNNVPHYKYIDGSSDAFDPSASLAWNSLYPTSQVVFATAAVPEPSSFLFLGLVGIGTMGWTTIRSHRRRS